MTENNIEQLRKRGDELMARRAEILRSAGLAHVLADIEAAQDSMRKAIIGDGK